LVLVRIFFPSPEDGGQFEPQPLQGRLPEHPVPGEEGCHQIATENWNPGAGLAPVLLGYRGTAWQRHLSNKIKTKIVI
jgi:hypothetical protein